MKRRLEITVSEEDSIRVGLIVLNGVCEKFACSNYNPLEYVDVVSINAIKDLFKFELICCYTDVNFYDKLENYISKFIDNYEIILFSDTLVE